METEKYEDVEDLAETIERKGGRSEFFIGQRNGNSSPYLKKNVFL